MTPSLKSYRVTAMMCVPLTCRVRAVNEHHAIALAKQLADDGNLDEDPFAGTIDDYEATEVVS